MSVRSLVLGLDVSPRRLGWGLVDLVTGEPVTCGCEPIDLPDHGWSHQQIARALEAPAHVPWHGDVNPHHYHREIQAVYIEQPALPPVSGTKSAYSAGRAVQSAHEACERRWPWADIQYLQPGEWRKLAGLAGNAPKKDVMFEATLFFSGVNGDQDAADALLIALAGQRRNQDTFDRSEAA